MGNCLCRRECSGRRQKKKKRGSLTYLDIADDAPPLPDEDEDDYYDKYYTEL